MLFRFVSLEKKNTKKRRNNNIIYKLAPRAMQNRNDEENRVAII